MPDVNLNIHAQMAEIDRLNNALERTLSLAKAANNTSINIQTGIGKSGSSASHVASSSASVGASHGGYPKNFFNYNRGSNGQWGAGGPNVNTGWSPSTPMPPTDYMSAADSWGGYPAGFFRPGAISQKPWTPSTPMPPTPQGYTAYGSPVGPPIPPNYGGIGQQYAMIPPGWSPPNNPMPGNYGPPVNNMPQGANPFAGNVGIPGTAYTNALANVNPNGGSAWQSFQSSILPGTTSLKAYGPGFGKGMMYAAGTSIAEYYSMKAHEELSGRIDPAESMVSPYKAAGGFIGAGVGAMFGGYGGLVGAAVGQQALGAFGSYVTAANVRNIRMGQAIQGDATLLASLQGRGVDIQNGRMSWGHGVMGSNAWSSGDSPISNPGFGLMNRMDDAYSRMETTIRVAMTGYFPDDAKRMAMTPTKEEIAKSSADITEGFLSAGIDPMKQVKYKELRGKAKTSRGLTGGALGARQDVDFEWSDVEGPLVDKVTTSAYTRWGQAATQILAKDVIPVMSASNRLGNNYTDIVSKLGFTPTLRYAEAMTNPGEAIPFDQKKLLESVGLLQGSQRRLEMSSYQARGVGASSLDTVGAMLNTLGSMPDGKSSAEYAKTQMQQRQFQLQAYQEQDITGYDIPMTKLQGERNRARILPFSPGNMFGIDLRMLGMEKKQLGQKEKQLNYLRSNNMLSEDQELRLTQEIEGLKTSSASHVAELSDGMLDRLPALSVGRPNRWSSYDSNQLAQLNLLKVNHPGRYYGAFNGQQAGMQDSFVRSFAVPGTGSPYSREQGIDATLPVLTRIADTLDRISRQQTGGVQRDTRPGENTGNRTGTDKTGGIDQPKGAVR